MLAGWLVYKKEVWIGAVVGFGIFLFGGVHAARRTKREGVALGFVCPRCGKGLFGHYHRFTQSGKCPSCHEFVAEELDQKLSHD